MNKSGMILGVGFIVASLQIGCAVESGPDSLSDEIRDDEQAAVTVRTHVYAFSHGSWLRSEFLNGATTNGTTIAFNFGGGGDTPLLGYRSCCEVVVGAYGDFTTDRKGKFYFDQNQNHKLDSLDHVSQFMPSNNIQSGDKPFVILAQRWRRDSNGNCAPEFTQNALHQAINVRMVGIQRGLTTFLDRDGDGIYQANGSNCDISTTGQFAASGDVAVGAERTSGGLSTFGTARVVGTSLNWFFDEDVNLLWTTPPDTQSTDFGTSAMTVPLSHPGGISVSLGRTVYHDFDSNHYWSAGDKTYVDVIPAGDWKLVGVDK